MTWRSPDAAMGPPTRSRGLWTMEPRDGPSHESVEAGPSWPTEPVVGPRRRGLRAGWGRETPRFAALTVLLAAALLSACTVAISKSGSPRGAGPTQKPSSALHQATTATTLPPATTTTTTTVPAQPGWNVLATEATGVAIDGRSEPMTDGTTITVIRFRAGQVHFVLHDGSQDPPVGSASLPPTSQSAISAAEMPVLLGAFNGGFEVSAGAGGVEIDGQVLTPLQQGMASLVIDKSGAATLGVWGEGGFPPSTIQVTSVRQNLPPLVSGGQPTPGAQTWNAWGATLGGGADVARSALGVDAAGNLLYAASMSTVPSDLADALVSAGAVTAMELDINPEWVQADVSPSPGAPLATGVPGQNRPANQYLTGWSRDFVTVLAGGPAPAG